MLAQVLKYQTADNKYILGDKMLKVQNIKIHPAVSSFTTPLSFKARTALIAAGLLKTSPVIMEVDLTNKDEDDQNYCSFMCKFVYQTGQKDPFDIFFSVCDGKIYFSSYYIGMTRYKRVTPLVALAINAVQDQLHYIVKDM